MAATGADSGAVGVLGATGFLGRAVVARWLRRHASGTRRLVAFSRSAGQRMNATAAGVVWRRLTDGHEAWGTSIASWVTTCPVWVLPAHFRRFEAAGVERIVAVSSTSVVTRRHAATRAERRLAARLATAEDELLSWAGGRGVRATLLRPTMIYDGIHDRNVAAIAGLIRRFGCFPVAGPAAGRRQPVHVDDVAAACLAAVTGDPPLGTYEICGGETLSFREMVRRIFGWLGREPRIVTLPGPVVRAARPLASLVPALGGLASFADRMNQDFVFDHQAATRDLGFAPRPFVLPCRRSLDDASRAIPAVLTPS